MASFLTKWKPGGAVCHRYHLDRTILLLDSSWHISQSASSPASKDAQKKKEKEEPQPELTPLEKMLQNASALRSDGSDKFFGLENVSPALETTIVV